MTRLLPLLLLLAAPLAGCGDDAAPLDLGSAARVGEEELTEAELQELLQVVPVGLDSLTARQQVVEQWVQRQLLAQEARRQGLLEDPEVREALAENERAVLAAALVERFFEANPVEPSDEDLAAYFSANRDQLTLREPYVRIRLLTLDREAEARAARAALVRAADTPYADSLWALAVREYASDPEGALSLAGAYLPESRLAGLDTPLADAVRTLAVGEVAPVVASGRRFHVLQLVDRVPTGTAPELTWVRDELRQRLAIEQRNATLARQVQLLKNEAQAEGRLTLR